ncbi:MAG TPA: hypothetical protein VIT45_04340 [Allosphingosinicella sp.]
MANGPARAAFWMEFVTDRCDYPAPDRLRAQLTNAEFSEFCGCGCNSFAVRVKPDVAPLARSGGSHGAIFAADFKLADDRTLEIILFANEEGNLDYIEVDCCANSCPVPDVIDVTPEPFRKWSGEGLLR